VSLSWASELLRGEKPGPENPFSNACDCRESQYAERENNEGFWGSQEKASLSPSGDQESEDAGLLLTAFLNIALMRSRT